MLCLQRLMRKQKRNDGRDVVNPTTKTTSAIVQTEDRPTTSAAAQTELFFHLFDLRELLLTVEIHKWQTTASHLQRVSIPLEAHQEGVRGIREQVMRVVSHYITQIEKAKQKREKQHKKYPLPPDDKNTIKTFDIASDEEEEFYVGEFLDSDDDLA